MRRALVAAVLTVGLFAHTPSAQNPAYEVASIRRVTTQPPGSSLNFLPGGRLVGVNVTPHTLVRLAYPTNGGDIEGVPAWAVEERYDIQATANRQVTTAENRLMLRALLAERFNLRAHLEDRERPVYALVLARPDGRLGPRIRRVEIDCEAIQEAQRRGQAVATPLITNGAPPCTSEGTGTIQRGGGVPMAFLAGGLAGPAGRTVVDRTGLTGRYEFTIEYQPQGASPGDTRPSVFTAVQEQLGLKLEPSTATLQVLVIENIERPTEN